MDKIIKVVCFLIFAISVSIVATSCRPHQAKSVVRTVGKHVDDYIDDVSRNGVKVKKNPMKPCRECNGNGSIYYQGYWYECSNCGGTGNVIIQ